MDDCSSVLPGVDGRIASLVAGDEALLDALGYFGLVGLELGVDLIDGRDGVDRAVVVEGLEGLRVVEGQ